MRGEGLSQSEAFPPLGAESTSSAIGDPYKLRCTSTSGSVLEYLLYRTLRTGAVGGSPTAKTLKFTGQEASSRA